MLDSRISVEEIYNDKYADDRDLLLMASDDVLLHLGEYHEALESEAEYYSEKYEKMVEDWTDKNRED